MLSIKVTDPNGLWVIDMDAKIYQDLWNEVGHIIGVGLDTSTEPQHTRMSLDQPLEGDLLFGSALFHFSTS